MARKQKVESKDKMELVQKYLKGEISQGEGQRLAGVAKSTRSRPIALYLFLGLQLFQHPLPGAQPGKHPGPQTAGRQVGRHVQGEGDHHRG